MSNLKSQYEVGQLLGKGNFAKVNHVSKFSIIGVWGHELLDKEEICSQNHWEGCPLKIKEKLCKNT